MLKVATDLVIHAQTCGLQLYCKSITKGDGSCFFHAVIDQVQHLSDGGGSHHSILNTAEPAADLRENVCNWMLTSSHPRIIQMTGKDISLEFIFKCIIGLT